MPERYDLIAIGDATVDVFLQIHDATVTCTLDARSCLLCLRYADKIPLEGVHRVPAAGNAANTAVGSARLGLTAALYTILGKDDDGKTLAAELKKNGVAIPYVVFDPRHATNYHTVLNFRRERTILVYHQPRTYRLPAFAPASWVYLTSMGKEWERMIRPLLRYLARTGASLAFNPGTYQFRSGLEVLRPLLAKTNVLLVNREEAARLLGVRAGLSPRTLLSRLATKGAKITVITDGPAGSYARQGSEAWFMPVFPFSARERTGAGDAFSTGFLAALAAGNGVTDALRWGTANAASVIQQIGPQAGLLTKAGLRRLLQRYRGLVAKPL